MRQNIYLQNVLKFCYFSSIWLKAVVQVSSRVWNIYHGCNVAYVTSVSLSPLRRKLGFQLFTPSVWLPPHFCPFSLLPGTLWYPEALGVYPEVPILETCIDFSHSTMASTVPDTSVMPHVGCGVKWPFLTPLCFVSANSCFHSYTKLSWIQGFRNEYISQYSKCLVKNYCDLNIMQNDLLFLSYTELCVLEDFYDNVSNFV